MTEQERLLISKFCEKNYNKIITGNFDKDWNHLMKLLECILYVSYDKEEDYDIDLIEEFHKIKDYIPDINATYTQCIYYINTFNKNKK